MIAPIDYYRANSLDEALTLLREHEGSKLLAGGHSLLPLLKLRLSFIPTLIDIGRIEALRGISHDSDHDLDNNRDNNQTNGVLRIGALTSHATLERSSEVPRALSEAASLIGDPAVRNRGTVGGSVAHADPASDLPTVLLALGTTLHLVGPGGERAVAAEDFFTGIFETVLGEDEVLTHITLPLAANSGSAYEKLADPASRYALVGAAAALTMQGGVCRAAQVAVGGLLPHAQRCPSVEAALVGTAADNAATRSAVQTLMQDIETDDVMGDLHSSAAYRLAVAPEIVRRAVSKAAHRAR